MFVWSDDVTVIGEVKGTSGTHVGGLYAKYWQKCNQLEKMKGDGLRYFLRCSIIYRERVICDDIARSETMCLVQQFHTHLLLSLPRHIQ